MQITKVFTANRSLGRNVRGTHPARANGRSPSGRPSQARSSRIGRHIVCHAESTHPSIRYVNEEELEVAIQSREKPLVIDLYVVWCRQQPYRSAGSIRARLSLARRVSPSSIAVCPLSRRTAVRTANDNRTSRNL